MLKGAPVAHADLRRDHELFGDRDLELLTRITTYISNQWAGWEEISLDFDRRKLRRLLREDPVYIRRYAGWQDWLVAADILVRGDPIAWARARQNEGRIGRCIFWFGPYPQSKDDESEAKLDKLPKSGTQPLIANRHRSRRSNSARHDSDSHLWAHVHGLIEHGPNWVHGCLDGTWAFGRCIVSDYESPDLESAVVYGLQHRPIEYRSETTRTKFIDPYREHIAAWAEVVREATGRKKLRLFVATRVNSQAGVPAVPSMIHGRPVPSAAAAVPARARYAPAVPALTPDRRSRHAKPVQRAEHHVQIGQDANAQQMSSSPSLPEPTLPARYFRLQRIAATPGRRPTAAAVRRLAEQLFNMEVQHMEKHGLPRVRRGKAGWLRQLHAEGIWHPDLEVDLREIEAAWKALRELDAKCAAEIAMLEREREERLDRAALRRFDPRTTSCPKAQELLRRLDWFAKNGKLIDAEPVRELMELLRKEQAELSAALIRPGEHRQRHSDVTILRSLRALKIWHYHVDEDLRHAQEEIARDREPYRRVCRATVLC